MTEECQHLLPFPKTPASVSIMQSKRELEEVLTLANNSQPNCSQNASLQCHSVNRQITSGMIVDWKQMKSNGCRQNELSLKDGDDGDRTIFEMLVEEWQNDQPAKVTYKWVRRPQNTADGLLEEEHLYRGAMLNRHKHGVGEYLITRRFKDNRETIKGIKGTWKCDILESGVVIDETGQEKPITKNILSSRSRRHITAMQANKTIYLETQRIAQKRPSFFKSTHNVDSKESASSLYQRLTKQQ